MKYVDLCAYILVLTIIQSSILRIYNVETIIAEVAIILHICARIRETRVIHFDVHELVVQM